MGRIAMDDTDCADCLCRVCARNSDNDSYNHQIDYATCHCDCEIGKTEIVETEEDCPDFLSDEAGTYTGDLKPCPFCGGDSENLDYGVTLSYPNDLYYVQCPECGIRCVMEHMETWNRRTNK